MRRKLVVTITLFLLLSFLWSIAYGESLPSVTGLKCEARTGHTWLTWKKVVDAQGYIVFRKVGNSGAFSYRSITESLSFADDTASTQIFNFYRVYPYKYVNGSRILGPSTTYTYAKARDLDAVKNLSALKGYKKVTLSWSKVRDADGYFIYGKRGTTGVFSYIGYTLTQGYTDKEASTEEINFYKVKPFKMIGKKRFLGPDSSYVYAIAAKVPPVSGLQATSENNRVRLTWNPVSSVEGYLIYRKIGPLGTFTYLYMTNSNHYVDTSASIADNNYYRIYPYKTEQGKRILGPSVNFVFAKAKDSKGYYELEAAKELLELINAYRVDMGLHALVETYETRRSAQIAAKMLSEDFNHTGYDTNIARFYPSAKACLEAWKRSPGHHYGLLGENDKYIGVGLYIGDTRYWAFRAE